MTGAQPKLCSGLHQAAKAFEEVQRIVGPCRRLRVKLHTEGVRVRDYHPFASAVIQMQIGGFGTPTQTVHVDHEARGSGS